MPPIEAGLAFGTMSFDDLQDAADYVCTERDFESANGDDEDEEEEEEEEKKKKEKDEEDEEDEEGDDDDGGVIECLKAGAEGRARYCGAIAVNSRELLSRHA